MSKENDSYEIIDNISECEFWRDCYNYSCMFKQGNDMPNLFMHQDGEQIMIRCKSQVEEV